MIDFRSAASAPDSDLHAAPGDRQNRTLATLRRCSRLLILGVVVGALILIWLIASLVREPERPTVTPELTHTLAKFIQVQRIAPKSTVVAERCLWLKVSSSVLVKLLWSCLVCDGVLQHMSCGGLGP